MKNTLTLPAFHKVSFDRFYQDSKTYGFVSDDTPIQMAKAIWENIKLPRRAETGSAITYDFFSPYPFCLQPGASIVLPSGVWVELPRLWKLDVDGKLCPRVKANVSINGLGESGVQQSNGENHLLVQISGGTGFTVWETERYMRGTFIPPNSQDETEAST